MQNARKLICILLGALMLMSALSGCAKQEADEGELFTVRACLCASLSSLDPAMSTDAAAESIFTALFENLLRFGVDEEGRPRLEPGVAREYQCVENLDGTVDYVFTLRSSARWSDGSRVKSKDFVYAWRRLVNPMVDSPNAELLSMVQGYDVARASGDMSQLAVKAEGDTTFRVTLSAPCPYFLTEVCTAVPTMPLRSDAARRNPNWATSTSVVSNGPFQVGVWAKENYLQLRRNPSYYESRAVAPDALRFLFALDGKTAWTLYDTGLLDYISPPPPDAEELARIPLRSTTCVLYNHVSDVFSNPHVRRAFDLSLDRGAVAAAMGPGLTPATGLVPYGLVNGAADSGEDFRAAGGELIAVDDEGYSMRCLEAETELRTGGYWGGVGFPIVTCLYVTGEESRNAAVAAAALWRERLNVSVVTEGVSREEFEELLASGEYDLAVDTIQASRGDAMDCLAPFAGTDGNNLLHYASKPYDLLIGVAASSHDSAARAAFLHDAEALLISDTALSPVCFGGASYLLNPALTGVRHDPRGNAYFDAVTKR